MPSGKLGVDQHQKLRSVVTKTHKHNPLIYNIISIEQKLNRINVPSRNQGD